ncbi:hypothetical protein Tco_0308056 [Tanacetum coccineum]|uniref:Uncharacterized protein n=1 Tax=Tanacetum coccineum TaxID=301880 RepID=A0ABQ4WVJ3_9ASTR
MALASMAKGIQTSKLLNNNQRISSKNPLCWENVGYQNGYNAVRMSGSGCSRTVPEFRYWANWCQNIGNGNIGSSMLGTVESEPRRTGCCYLQDSVVGLLKRRSRAPTPRLEAFDVMAAAAALD